MKFHAWGKLKLTIKLLVVPVPCSLVPLERNLPALLPPNLIEIMAHGWMDVPTMLPSLVASSSFDPVAADGLRVPSPIARPPDSSWRRFTESRGGTREGESIERRRIDPFGISRLNHDPNQDVRPRVWTEERAGGEQIGGE